MNPKKYDLDTAPLDGQWAKSSYSTTNGDACIQLMRINGGVAVGDSKNPARVPLRYTNAEMTAFLQAVKGGTFDHLTDN